MIEHDDLLCALPKVSPLLNEDPINFLVAEHERQRKICAVLGRSVRDGSLTGQMLRRLCDFTRLEFERHHRFEGEMLFPLLLRRMPEDGGLAEKLQDVIGVQKYALRWSAVIGGARNGALRREIPPINDKTKNKLMAYTKRHFSCLTYENAVVLRIAETVLRKSDIEKLSVCLKAQQWP